MTAGRDKGLLVLVLALGLSSQAVAGTPDVVEDARLETVQADLAQVFEAAEEEGLPAGILEDKIREGLAKKVPAKKILAAVVKLEKVCSEASAMLVKAGHKPAKLTVRYTAELMQSGVSKTETKRLLDAFAKWGKKDLGKGLLAALAVRETGSTSTEAVDRVLGAYKKKGVKGLDSLLKETSKSPGKPVKKPGKSSKGKSPKKPSKAPGKSKGSKGSHGK
jgi:hypothetical protein